MRNRSRPNRGTAVLAGCAAALSIFASARAEDVEITFETRPGWTWLVSPVKIGWPAATEHGVLSARPPGADGWQSVLLAREEDRVVEPRPRIDAVLFDSEGARLLSVGDELEKRGGGVLASQYLFPAPESEAVYVGIEEASPEGLKLLSEDARRRAAEVGLAALPFPETGRAFSLDLDLGEGGAIRAADHAGRVVLVDLWAAWCVPCMRMMPQLVELHEEFHDRGFDIVGINFDFQREGAEAVAKEHGLVWPHVFAGATPPVLDLWRDAVTVGGIPRMFLVDRKGVLRWDGTGASAEEMAERVRSLLAE